MTISDREITQDELKAIYADFEEIERRDGVPLCKQKRYSHVAEENGIAIGFASGLTNHKWFCLTDLWVHEDFRRQGLGSGLLTMPENTVRSIGVAHIYTWTSGFRNPLFYEALGYRVFTVFEDFFEVEGYHHIGYRKDLL